MATMLPIYIAAIVVILCALALAAHVARVLWRLTRPTPREPATPAGYRENAQAPEGDVGDDDDLAAARIATSEEEAMGRLITALLRTKDLPTLAGATPGERLRPRAPRPGPAPRPISE